MLIIGLCMLFVSTLVELFSETVPVWLVTIANILFFTGQMLCFISWYFLTKKIIINERAEKSLDDKRKDVISDAEIH